MNEMEQKKLASQIVIKAMNECNKFKIDPYIKIGAFIDETIRELSRQNNDERVASFLESIAKKVKTGIYRKKN